MHNGRLNVHLTHADNLFPETRDPSVHPLQFIFSGRQTAKHTSSVFRFAACSSGKSRREANPVDSDKGGLVGIFSFAHGNLRSLGRILPSPCLGPFPRSARCQIPPRWLSIRFAR